MTRTFEHILIPYNGTAGSDKVRFYQKMKKIYESVKGKHITIDTSLDPERNAKLVSTKILNSAIL